VLEIHLQSDLYAYVYIYIYIYIYKIYLYIVSYLSVVIIQNNGSVRNPTERVLIHYVNRIGIVHI
jgi:hypothetical protein